MSGRKFTPSYWHIARLLANTFCVVGESIRDILSPLSILIRLSDNTVISIPLNVVGSPSAAADLWN